MRAGGSGGAARGRSRAAPRAAAGGAAGTGGTGGASASAGTACLDPGEGCDDGNRIAGDGCSVICQIEAGWSCPASPSVCTLTAICGDGMPRVERGVRRRQHDGRRRLRRRTASSVDPGYECRVPGRRCVPACGDGMKIGAEQCDDGNTAGGDGCSRDLPDRAGRVVHGHAQRLQGRPSAATA